MPVRFPPAVLTSLALGGALMFGGLAQAQADSQEAGLRIAVSAEQAQQIISERLLQDSVAAAYQTLRQKMALTPAQDDKWRDFMQASMARPTPELLATIDDDATPLHRARLGLDLQRRQVRLEAQRVRAMERFYKALDPQQKAVFDQGVALIGNLTVAKVEAD